MQDVLNGMSPGDAWALHGSPLFNRAAFEGYTRAESNYRQFSGIMAGILVLGAGMPYVVAAAPFLSQGFGLMGGAARTAGSQAYNFAASYVSKAWAFNKISFGFEFGTQTIGNIMSASADRRFSRLFDYNITALGSKALTPWYLSSLVGNSFAWGPSGYRGFGSESTNIVLGNILIGAFGDSIAKGLPYGLRYLLTFSNNSYLQAYSEFLGTTWFAGFTNWIFNRYYGRQF